MLHSPRSCRALPLLATLWLLAATDGTLMSAQPAPSQFPGDLVEAWQKGGAKVGWLGRDAQDGIVKFKPESEGLVDAVPTFRFSRWVPGLFTRMPNPKFPFGMRLANASDEAIKEL